MTGSCYDGSTDFKWIKDNEPFGGSLDVYEIAEVANFEASEGKTPFDRFYCNGRLLLGCPNCGVMNRNYSYEEKE